MRIFSLFLQQERNGSGLLLDYALSMKKDDDQKPDFSIPVAALFDSIDRDLLLEFIRDYPESKFFIYAPDSGQDEKRFDASLVVILVMAVFTVMVGSFWSGVAKHQL